MNIPREDKPRDQSMQERLREWITVPLTGEWPTRNMDDDIRAAADLIDELHGTCNYLTTTLAHATLARSSCAPAEKLVMDIAHIVMGFRNEDSAEHYNMLRDIEEAIGTLPECADTINAAGPELPATAETRAIPLSAAETAGDATRSNVAQQPAPAAPSAIGSILRGDKGPWTIRRDGDRGYRIRSGDFVHDVELILTGDFKNEDQMMEYAADIARALQAASERSASAPAKESFGPYRHPDDDPPGTPMDRGSR